MGSIRYQDFTDPLVECRGVAASHRALLDHLEAIGDTEPDRPSRLDGWTVAHVLTHVARNADSHLAMLAGEVQYDDGWAGRDRVIAEGGGRTWNELVDEVADTAAKLDRAYGAERQWDRDVLMLAGRQRAGFLPLARRREVEVHRADLGLGYELDDVPIDYVARDLRFLEAWWIAKHRAETSELPGEVRDRTERQRWSWLVGRLAIDGVEPAALF